jgi:hypothetical protein
MFEGASRFNGDVSGWAQYKKHWVEAQLTEEIKK